MHRSRQRALIPLLIVVFVGGLAGGYAAGRQVTQWIVGTPCGQGAPADQRGLLGAGEAGAWGRASAPSFSLEHSGGGSASLVQALAPTSIRTEARSYETGSRSASRSKSQ